MKSVFGILTVLLFCGISQAGTAQPIDLGQPTEI